MKHSILLRLINGLKRVGNHVAKHFVDELRCAEMHPNAAFNLDNSVRVSVKNARPESQIHDAGNAARFGQEVDIGNRASGVSYLPFFGAGYEHPTGFNHDLISHQNLPFSDAVRVVERARQVESAA